MASDDIITLRKEHVKVLQILCVLVEACGGTVGADRLVLQILQVSI